MTDSGFSDSLHELEIKAQPELQRALSSKESFWKQKANLSRFTRGDRNTAFFHRIA